MWKIKTQNNNHPQTRTLFSGIGEKGKKERSVFFGDAEFEPERNIVVKQINPFLTFLCTVLSPSSIISHEGVIIATPLQMADCGMREGAIHCADR